MPGFQLLDLAGPADVFDMVALFSIEGGHVWTAAGVLSGVGLALALVARDHGHALAAMVARGLVVHLHRPGGQSQFSTPMRAVTPRSAPLRELQAYIDGNPCADLSVPALAARAGMSERHFWQGRNRSPNAWSSTAGSSPLPGCRRASTWR